MSDRTCGHKQHTTGCDVCSVTDIQSRLTQAEEALMKIQKHEHCDPKYIFEHPDECHHDGSDKYWFAEDVGRANGHRCAAAIATAYFRGK